MKSGLGVRMVLAAGVCLSGLTFVSVPSLRGQHTALPSVERNGGSDAERLRAIARDLLAKPGDAATVDRAAQLLQRAAEIENQQAQAEKSATEQQKLKQDLAQSRFFSVATTLSPLFTTVLLAGTLLLQTFTYKQQRVKDAEAAQRQMDDAEDKRWNESIKVMSDDHELSPAGVLLATFSQSRRYGDRARDLALQLLTRSKSIEEFSGCLANLFEPVNWTNIKWILEADRSIVATYRRLDIKTWVQSKKSYDMNVLTADERATHDLAVDQVQTLATKVGALLKSPRPPLAGTLDLSGTNFWRCDWKGADLTGAVLTNCYLEGVDLDSANFSAIARYEGAKFDHCAWWKAAKISGPLLNHLLETSPFKEGEVYGSEWRTITRPDYEASLLKLKTASSIG